MLSLDKITEIGIGTLKENKKQGLSDALISVGLTNVSITGYQVETGVSNMPLSTDETIQGSINRAKNCFLINSSLDFSCGAEGGVFFNQKKTKAYMVGAITLLDSSGYINTSTGGDVLLPEIVTLRLLDGEELGDIMDDMRSTTGANHKEGAMGFFTTGLITRGQAFEYMTLNALVPRLHPTLY